ncbi:SURF1 family cytochrome oxidase biogenesis protein [Brachybacterium hainanense]|uniref:SURF1-like protein n=1 Tax=Brachybacterium hainanense TaxID=1541174 RepID=A0ABV6RCK0_9MICO
MSRPDGASRSAARDLVTAVLAVTLAAALCIGLGLWQWHRFENRREIAATVRANIDADPVALDQVLDGPDRSLPPSRDWTPVELTGSYCTDPGCVLYVRNRPLGGSVGFWQLVPFETDAGTLLIVRGWIDSDEVDSAPVSEPEVPAGEITVTAHLRPAEEVLEDRSNPPGQVQSVAPVQFAAELPVAGPVYTGVYGDLIAESPADVARPQPLEEPDTSLGPHLSYAFQWWIFALFFPAALIIRARRTRRDERAAQAEADASRGPAPTEDGGGAGRPGAGPGDPPSPGSAALGSADRSPRRSRRGSEGRSPEASRNRRARSLDEEEEDALLDDRDR